MSAVFTAIILGMGRLVLVFNSFLVGRPAGTSLAVMGVLGFLLMCGTVAAGVWISVRISLGKAAGDNPSFSWWVINRLAFLVGSTNIASFTIFYLQGKLGLVRETAAGPASRLLMFVGIFILILGFPGGWLSDHIGRKPLVAASGVIAALGALILVLAPDLAAIYLGAIFMGAGIGLFYTASWALGTDIVPQEEAGRYLGIANLAGAGAGAVGAYIGGPIADFFTVNYPTSPGLGYILLYTIYGLLFVFSVLVLGKIKPRFQPV
jgi:MFS family permease